MLTTEQHEILVGALLGDASVEKNGLSHRIRFDYSVERREYVHWLAKKLQPYSKKITEYQRDDERTKKKYKKIRFYTSTEPLFDKYRSMFYTSSKGGKNTLPPNIKELLSSKLTLAIWFLDDGAKRIDSNAYRLHTECFPLKDVKKLIDALYFNFGIQSKEHPHTNKGFIDKVDKNLIPLSTGFLIHIGSRGGHAKKLNEEIKNFVASEIPSMVYKFF